MKFAVDCMLGKLAKWLRILGFDAVFFPRISDDDLLALAAEEGRTLLTRDTGLIQRAGHLPRLFITSEDWKSQVDQVLGHFNLTEHVKPFSRCLRCNRALIDLPKARARNLVTPHVFEQAENFALCPDCGRVYWKGTHLRDMDARLREILGEEG
jgi:uncharacterized protein with PIN domain